VLVVSGGHTSLFLVPEPGVYRLVGRTRDDAAGEAYDKVAKLLGLGYPGGPAIDRIAREGDDLAVDLPRPRFTHADRHPAPADLAASSFHRSGRPLVEFSFSGLKTAVLRHVQSHGVPEGRLGSATTPHLLSPEVVRNVAASFQRVVVESLVDRTFEAARSLGAASVGIAGGVSANSRLRRDAEARGVRDAMPVFIPALALSTDNAAMIAAAGLRRLERGGPSPLDFNAQASLDIA
jgi:N6-L-threonylcarbamoyladenine synthase